MGGKRQKRKRLATGIYADKYGISISIRGKEYRYPLGTPTEDLIKKRRDLLADAPLISRRGTVAGAITAYLATMPDGSHAPDATDDERRVWRRKREMTTQLQHWATAFGSKAVGEITPILIRQQLAEWASKPSGKLKRVFGKKHLNNLIHALRAVYRANYGAELNPAADVPIFTVRYDDARAIPYALIERIIDGMPDRGQPVKGEKISSVNLAKLRFRVMAHTGLDQASLKRVEDKHLNLRTKQVYATTRLKGGGFASTWITLTNDGAAAFRALQRAGGLGYFSTRSLAYCWRRAIDRERKRWHEEQATHKHPKQWPLLEDVRAYDLRHSFGTAILAITGDVQAGQEMMRHASPKTTMRYGRAAAKLRASLAVQSMNRARMP